MYLFSEKIQICQNTVYVADTAQLHDDALFAAAVERVSPGRREKAGRIKSRARAAQSVAAELLLRTALREAGITKEPEFAFANSGKPYLSNIQGVYFSLSHTTGLAACAVSLGGEIGVDAERVRGFDWRVAERCFSAAERERIETAPESARVSEFFQIWTLKESVIKAFGGVRMDSFETSRGGAVRFYSETAGTPELSAGSIMRGGFAIAVCVRL